MMQQPQVLGTYSNGAVKIGYKDWKGHEYNTHIVFIDCPDCKGTGIVTLEKTSLEWRKVKRKWEQYLRVSTEQIECSACKSRFADKATLKTAIEGVITSVKGELSIARQIGKDVKDSAYIESFNVDNPLAREYRRLLKAWWSYQEPEFTPCN